MSKDKLASEEQFLLDIEDETGMKLGEYGFIAGNEGFEVWKSTPQGAESINIIPKDFEDSKKQIIEFLKK